MPEPDRDTPHLGGIQMLRGVAALMVLVGHVLAEAQHYFGLPIPLATLPWTRGVDIFFVISGFVVALSAGRYAGRPGAFLARRAARVVPLYWLFTSLMVAVLLLAPGAAKDTALEPAQIVSSYFFLPYERHDGRIAPVLSLGWTLNYEMWFYALLALALTLRSPLATATGALAGLVVAGLLFPGASALWICWTNPLILEFAFGMGLAFIWSRRGGRIDGRFGPGILVLALALMVTLDSTSLPRVIAAGVPAALIVAAATLFWGKRRAPGQRLGDASYALYLSHRFVLRPLTLILIPVLPGGAGSAAIFAIVATGLALAVAFAVHAGFERPMMARLDRRRLRPLRPA